MKNNLFEEVSYTQDIVRHTFYKDVLLKIIKSISFLIPLLILLVIFITGLIIDISIDKKTYMGINTDISLISPNKNYLFGTNEFGQNLFYQVFVGSYNTLKLAAIATIINLILGSLIGIVWGNNSKFDSIMLLIKNIFDNIPSIFFYIIIIAALGSGFIPLLIIITLFEWINTAFLIRNNLLLSRNNDYNLYSKINKTPFVKVILNNYLPSLLPILFNSIALSFPQVISLETTISYFGLSLGTSDISLGKIISSTISTNIGFAHPYLFYIPLIFLFTINTCFFQIGKIVSNISTKGGYKNDKYQ